MSLYTDFWDVLYRLRHPTRNSVHSKAHFVIDKGYDILILSCFCLRCGCKGVSTRKNRSIKQLNEEHKERKGWPFPFIVFKINAASMCHLVN